MSSFIKDGYYCIDNYFGDREYGFVKMTEEEEKAKIGEKWKNFDFSALEGRGGTRPVIKEIPKEFENIPISLRHNFKKYGKNEKK